MFITKNSNEYISIQECYDKDAYVKLLEEVLYSDIPTEYKELFCLAATRFINLNYSKIAQLYYNLDDLKLREMFKKLNLVIVSDREAIENGYIRLTNNLLNNLDKYITKGDEKV